MFDARFTAHPAFSVGPVPPRLFGSFVEHMGRCVYTGIYEPGHATADSEGFRQDVMELVRELGVTTIRYPGGNFVSGYQWEDGVGPAADRPKRLDLAWHTTETNQFGLNEFMRWAAQAGVEPMMAVNLGTRGVREALDLLEYSNHPGGSTLSERRIADGATEPHDVRMWCLGNEMDGPWQTGHKTAAEYGRLAAETAKAMRQYDPTLELVACGSSNMDMPTFGAWESEVLEEAWDAIDFVSLHAYYEPVDGDVDSFLASAVGMDAFIEAVIATADAVGARRHSDKKLGLSFDEWNVWYAREFVAKGTGPEWSEAPRLIEDEYSVTDAVVVGSLLISLLRHADRVTSASLAQLVNVIAPIRSEPDGPAWRQTIFHPFAQTAARAKGRVLRTTQTAPTLPTARYGDAPVVDSVLTHDEDSGSLVLFAINRSQSESVALIGDVATFGALAVGTALVLSDADPSATNTAEHQDRVVPRTLDKVELLDGELHLELPPLSWVMVTLDRA
ncbi:alpha-N-arabinofuranosidase [Nakamurella sp. UYEF19]|uniref:arabinosylfuranosidase ArfA n=1 Tax=Nakamurella sp. UYEF19 TaxID=1756392 RepID=UPI003399A89B